MKLILAVSFILSTSLLAAENPYIEAGIPATDREWTGRDYIATQEILASGKVPIPVLTDEVGKRVVTRLTDTKNFAFYRNQTLPIGNRLGDFLEVQKGHNEILKLYAFAAVRGEKLNSEITQLMAFSLHLAALGIDLVNEFVPTIPKDETYPTRMDGLKQMYRGLTTAFGGAEMSLTETDFYTAANLRTLLEAMNAALPTIQKAFSSEYRAELELKLKGHLARFDGEEEELIKSMLKTLSTGQTEDDRPE